MQRDRRDDEVGFRQRQLQVAARSQIDALAAQAIARHRQNAGIHVDADAAAGGPQASAALAQRARADAQLQDARSAPADSAKYAAAPSSISS